MTETLIALVLLCEMNTPLVSEWRVRVDTQESVVAAQREPGAPAWPDWTWRVEHRVPPGTHLVSLAACEDGACAWSEPITVTCGDEGCDSSGTPSPRPSGRPSLRP